MAMCQQDLVLTGSMDNGRSPHAHVEGSPASSTVFLGLSHRKICTGNQLFRIGSMIGPNGNTNADTDLEDTAAYFERLNKGFRNLVDVTLRLLERDQRQKDREFVSTQPADRGVGAQRRRQTDGDRPKEAVAHRMAQAVVDI